MESESKVLALWNDVKQLVEGLELDVNKNSRGNLAAGVRARKGLRDIKVKATALVKLTVELDKSKKENSLPKGTDVKPV
jgi:hypothetical protein